MRIFISHSSKDAYIANELCNVIETSSHTCFIAPRDIRSGYEYAEEIANGVDDSEVLLLVLSKAANQSPHVLREVERAVTKAIPILVYKIEEVELTKSMEYFLMTHQWMIAGKDSYEDVVCCVDRMKQPQTKDMPHNLTKENGIDKKNKKVVTIVLAVFAIFVLAVLSVLIAIIVYRSKQGNGKNYFETKSENSIIGEDALAKVEVGDTIVMGTYNDEQIYWRVIQMSEDKTKAVVVSRDVLSVKAYDAADSGKYNHDGTENYFFSDTKAESDMELQAFVRGNSSWQNSNIRTWLNSADEMVTYEGQVPSSSAMADGVNGYHNEKGFLCSFTDTELAAILETEVKTKANALSDQDTIITKDKVFLLSKDELEWFNEANVSMLAVPTQGAIKNNETTWYQDYCLDMGVENMMWWLREPVADSSSKCYLVGNGYHEENIYEWEVGVESFGIRPAMTISLESGAFVLEKN